MRGDVAIHVRLIVDRRDDDTRPAVLLDDAFPVFVLGHGERVEGMLVLILNLEEDDGPAVCDLCVGNDLANLACVVVGGIHERLRAGPQRPGHACQPAGEPATGDLCVDVGSRTGQDIEASFLGRLEERLEGKDAIGAEVAALRLEEVPVDVDGNAVVPRSLDLLEDIGPETGNGQTEGVELGAEDHETLPMDEEAVVVPGDDVLLSALEVISAVSISMDSGGQGGQGQAQGEALEGLREEHRRGCRWMRSRSNAGPRLCPSCCRRAAFGRT